jgi:hypothetical protein
VARLGVSTSGLTLTLTITVQWIYPHAPSISTTKPARLRCCLRMP